MNYLTFAKRKSKFERWESKMPLTVMLHYKILHGCVGTEKRNLTSISLVIENIKKYLSLNNRNKAIGISVI